MARITRAQAFGEGNKRTSLIVAAKYLADRGVDHTVVDSGEVRRLLVRASVGDDVEAELIAALREP
jgi:prophage maintenance system killer protein